MMKSTLYYFLTIVLIAISSVSSYSQDCEAIIEITNNIDNVIDCDSPSIILDGSNSIYDDFFLIEYLWVGNTTGPTLEVFAAGEYQLEITTYDEYGLPFCDDFTSIIIDQNFTEPVINVSLSNNLDCNNTSAILDASTSVGQGDLLFDWSNGSTDESIEVFDGADYFVTVTDLANGCFAISGALSAFSNFDEPTINVTLSNDLDCNNTSAILDASTSVGQGDLLFDWSNGSSDESIEVFDGADYFVTVTDLANGCFAVSGALAAFSNFDEPDLTLDGNLVIDCENAEAFIDAGESEGQGNITYLWSDGSTESTIIFTEPTSFTVTIFDDANGCSSESPEFFVTENFTLPTVIIDAPTTELTCTGSSIILDGSSSSGQGNLSFEWGSGETTPTLEVTSPGIYELFVFDDENSCIGSEIIEIFSNDAAPQIILTGPIEITCDQPSVIIDASMSNGLGPITFLWEDGSTESFLEVFEAGSYGVTITDTGNGCTATTSDPISENITPPTAIITTSNDAIGCDNNTAILDASTSTGQGALSYLWEDGSTNETLVVGSAGFYSVTVTDPVNGCVGETVIEITSDAEIPFADIIASDTDFDCNTFSINLDASGSTPTGQLNFDWSTGATTQDIDIVSSGNYTVTVTDINNGCTAFMSIEIGNNFAPPAAVIDPSSTVIDCIDTDVILDASASNGQGLLSFEWSDGSTNNTLEVSSAGTYSVTVTDDATGCTDEASVTISNESELPEFDFEGITEINCFESSVTISISTSIDPDSISYVWSDGSMDSELTVFVDGIYSLTVTDTGSGCTASMERTITENITEPIVDIGSSSMILDCDNSVATLDGSGSNGQGAISFLWSTGETTSTIEIANAETYGLTITDDANGCQNETSITITDDGNTPDIIWSQSDELLTCVVNDIILDASASSGLSDLSFEWSDGSMDSTLIISDPGTYSLTVTDVSGCTSSSSLVITENVIAPIAIIELSSSELTCDTLEIVIDAQNSIGQGMLSYEWSNGSTDSITVVAAAGTYSLTITDQLNGCEIIENIEITDNGDTPDLVVDLETNILSCDQESILIDASMSSAAGGVSFLWNDGSTESSLTVEEPGIYTITIFDVGDCSTSLDIVIEEDIMAPTAIIDADNLVLDCLMPSIILDASNSMGNGALMYDWSTGETTPTIEVSAASTFTVTVTDSANGCTSSESIEITSDGVEPVLVLNVTALEFTCDVTSITMDATASTGQGNISYLWDDGSTDPIRTVTEAGNYNITITDDFNGCSATGGAPLTENILAPTSIITTSTGENIITCSDPQLTLDASGSTVQGTASYEWSDGSTGATLDIDAASTFTVTVTDSANGCTSSESIEITSDGVEPVLGLNVTALELTCDVTSITMDATASTGQGNISYLWDDGSTDPIRTVTEAGNYNITITDDFNGCSATGGAPLTENILAPTSIITTSTGENIITCTDPQLTLDASSSTVQGTATYEWSDGSTGATLDIDAASTFTVTVTDSANGCTSSESIVITSDGVEPVLNLGVTALEFTCDVTSITMDATASTGQGNISYLWDDGSTDPIRTVTEAGNYNITITDDFNGCSATGGAPLTENILVPTSIITTSTGENIITCADPQLTLDASSSTVQGTATYEWSDGSTGATLDIDAASTFTVTVTDSANGCTSSESIEITSDGVEPVLVLNVTALEFTCDVTSITMDATASTGQGNISYLWDDGSTDPIRTVTEAGNYNITITDDFNGCSATGGAPLTENILAPTSIITTSTGENIITCADPQLTLDASGSTVQGTASYEWSDGSTGATLDIDAASTFTVTVTDSANGCTSSESIAITSDGVEPVLGLNVTALEFTCDVTSITMDATASTGQGNISYLWDDGSTDPIRTVTEAGNYNITITDDFNGCSATGGAPLTENILVPTSIITTSTGENIITCADPQLTLDASSSTVQGTATYEWSDGSTEATLDIDAASTFTVTVTDSANGCTSSESIVITSDGVEPVLGLNVTALEFTCDVTSITMDATASTGQGNISYLWDDGSTDPIRTVTEAGNYNITITDDFNGCSATGGAPLTENILAPTSIITTSTGENIITCADPQLTLDASGSTVQGTATYEWSDGSTGATLDIDAASTFTVTVTDSANGCTSSESIVITSDGVEPVLNLGVTALEFTCDVTSITMDATASTGQGNISYLWDDGSTDPIRTVTEAGNYNITITDDFNGCSATGGAPLTENILAPTSTITTSTGENIITCSDPQLTLDASSSTVQGTATYEWSDGSTEATLDIDAASTFTVTVTDSANGCTSTESIEITESFDVPVTDIAVDNLVLGCVQLTSTIDASGSTGVGMLGYMWSTGSTESMITVTEPGTYFITITDLSNGCGAVENIIIIEDVTAPTAVINNSSSVISCTNNEITLDANESTGLGVLSYQWSTGETESSIVVNSEGDYSVTVTDSVNSCSSTASVSITEESNTTIALINSVTTQLDCLVESILLDGSGSTVEGTAEFLWSDGSDTDNITVTTAGTYSLTVTDSDTGCTDVTSIEITDEASTLTVILESTFDELSCAVGSVDIDASMSTGLGSLSYEWSTGETDAMITVTSSDIYNVTVTDDANGCTSTESIEITENFEFPDTDIAVDNPILDCTNITSTIDASGSTGVGMLGYMWSTGSTESMITVTEPGTYFVTVTDLSNGCEAVENIIIIEDTSEPVVTASSDSQLYCVGSQVVLTATIDPSFSYDWTGPNGISSNTEIFNIDNAMIENSGTYTVVVTGNNGCTASDQVTISVDEFPPVEIISSPNNFPLCSNDGLELSVVEDSNVSSYIWTSPVSNTIYNTRVVTLSAEEVEEGTYTLLLSTSNGCESMGTLDVTLSNEASTFNTNFLVGNLACVGDQINFIDYSTLTEEELENATFFWDFGNGATSVDRDPQFSYGESGVYQVHVEIGGLGCGGASIDKQIEIVDCLKQPNQGLASKVYPTLNNGFMDLEVVLFDQSNIEIRVFNMASGQLDQSQFYYNINSLNERLFIQQPGIYIVQIHSTFGIDTHKIIVVD